MYKNQKTEFNTEESGHGQNSTYEITRRLVTENNPNMFLTIPELEAQQGHIGIVEPHEAWNILKKMKSDAAIDGDKIASNVSKSAQSLHTGKWRPGISRQICSILNANNVRRQESLSEDQMDARALKMRSLIMEHHDPKLTIVGLPSKFDHPTKADGPFPDLGEASVLLRFWKIASACEKVRQSEADALRPLMDSIFPEIAEKNRGDALRSIYQEGCKEDNTRGDISTYISRISQDENIAKSKKKQLRAKAATLGEYVSGISITNPDAFYELLIPCLKENVHPASLLEFTALSEDSIRLDVVRDPRRYPCFRAQSDKALADYGQGLDEMVEGLHLSEHLKLETLESKLEKLSPEMQAHYKKSHTDLYENFLSGFNSEIDRLSPDLFQAQNKGEFFDLVRNNERLATLESMFEPILFSVKHPIFNGEYGSQQTKSYLHSLANIYSPSARQEDETLRQKTLLETLKGAAEYVSAYSANTGSRNHLNLDDVELLMGGEVTRLSIHKKSPELGQFSVLPGSTVHRTPWQSSSLLISKKDSTLGIDSKLAIELKATEHIPMLVAKNENSSDWLTKIADQKQPLFWVNKGSSLHQDGRLSEDFSSMLMYTHADPRCSHTPGRNPVSRRPSAPDSQGR